MIIEVGDKVKIKPRDKCQSWGEAPGYTNGMESFASKVATVASITPNGVVRLDIDGGKGYWWKVDWLVPIRNKDKRITKIEEPEETEEEYDESPIEIEIVRK